MTIMLHLGMVLGCFSAPAQMAFPQVGLVLPPGPSPVVRRIGRVLTRQIEDRCDARVAQLEAPFTIVLAVEKGIGTEGFRIEDHGDGQVRIVGNDECGLLYGVGKFLRGSSYGPDGFTPGSWRGTSVPVCPVRGLYFATHFNNYYEAAPEEEVERYLEDLALWGVNSIVMHFPCWQFEGFHDPAAQAALARQKQIMRAGKALGMRMGLIQVANESFKSLPDALRNTPVPDPEGRHGNFGVQICPAKPAARERRLQEWNQLLDAFASEGLDYLVFWPYDEGGCGCSSCQPWGGRGFPALCRALSAAARHKFPHVRIVLSAWTFDTPPCGEWQGLTEALKGDASWVDYIQADAHEGFPRYPLDMGVPGGLPLLNFPEISMWGQNPWGGYGSNPLPARFQRLWDETERKVSGGFPYSEGIYEDLNKVIVSQFYWNPERSAAETVREYIAFEYGPAVVEELEAVVSLLEKNHPRDHVDASAVEAFERAQRAEAVLTPQARRGWRWRILYLRALIDKELHLRDGKLEGPVLKAAFEELTSIYHAENAHSMPIRPPEVK